MNLMGKNRYLHPLYHNSDPGSSPSSRPDGQNLPRLVLISIDMGNFSDHFYGELQQMLGDSYNVTLDLTENEINAFLNEQTSELVLEYEDGKVLLKVVRRKFGNLVLKVIYQSDKMAAESRTPHAASIKWCIFSGKLRKGLLRRRRWNRNSFGRTRRDFRQTHPCEIKVIDQACIQLCILPPKWRSNQKVLFSSGHGETK